MKQKLSFDGIKSAPRPSVACDEEFEIQVEYSVSPVGRCSDPTNEEKQRMTRGLAFELNQKATQRCRENQACPHWDTLRGEEIESRCEPNREGVNVWTSKWSFIVKCTM